MKTKKQYPEMSPEQRSQFYAKLDIFLKRVQEEREARCEKEFPVLHKMATDAGEAGWHYMGYDDQGERFVRVWDGSGTKAGRQQGVTHFVEKHSGVIFGAKGWKAYNPNHEYGTLDTIDEWDWSGYYAVNKLGKKSLVPVALRR